LEEEDISRSVNNYFDTNDNIDDKNDEEFKAMMKGKKECKKTQGSNEDSEDKGEEV
jgi:hypothetical protein